MLSGANAAVDGRSTSYWASAFDVDDPVEFTVDFGGARRLSDADIRWEYPPRSFTVAVSVDGEHWSDVFSTDSNVLNSTRISMGPRPASRAKLVMRAAHPLYGKLDSRALYGIRTLAFYAPRLRTIVEDCVKASQSPDARDK